MHVHQAVVHGLIDGSSHTPVNTGIGGIFNSVGGSVDCSFNWSKRSWLWLRLKERAKASARPAETGGAEAGSTEATTASRHDVLKQVNGACPQFHHLSGSHFV